MPDHLEKSLFEKLDIKRGKIVAIGAPENYPVLLGPLPAGTNITSDLMGRCEFVHYFTSDQTELQQMFPKLKAHVPQGGALWISWPKKASQLFKGLNENMVRNIGLRGGLIEVKGCEINNDWSSMKFMYRLNPRKQARKPGPTTAASKAKEERKNK